MRRSFFDIFKHKLSYFDRLDDFGFSYHHSFLQALFHHSSHGGHHHQTHYNAPYSHKAALREFARGDYEYRQIDGTENNPLEPSVGMAGEALLRKAPPDYGDGFNSPAGAGRPSARFVSNEIFDQDVSIPNSFDASAMFWLWGQFVDHDIDLSPEGDEPFPISVPLGDAFFDPFFTGTQTIDLHRTEPVDGTGVPGIPREQPNAITPYIDASNVYGSDQERADFLRTFSDGLLKTSAGDLLPFNDGTIDNAGGPSTELFVGGDVRANENIGLTSMHTLFVREHNFWAEKLARKNPSLSDEELYQRAKLIVTAEIEAITFNEFLPLLLGDNAIPEYSGYDVWEDPQIANVFSTAAYRLGHTLLSINIPRLNEDGSEAAAGNLALRDAFFQPMRLQEEGGIDTVLRGFGENPSQEVDSLIIDEVRNFLFGPPGAGGLDLASLNIQRGRDHGLPDYNSVREAYDLDAVVDFSDITTDLALQQMLMDVYGSVDNIDVFVGGLMEDEFGDSMLGELFHTIVLDQFLRLRDADSHWYENQLSDDQIEWINDTSLADVILRNTDIDFLQDEAMIVYDRLGGTNGRDTLVGTDGRDLLLGFNGKDILMGGDGDDELFGGNGKDKINGGDGDDRLTGGDGKDHFIIGLNQGHDIITDYQKGKDKIDLSDHDLSRRDLKRSMDYEDGDTVIDLGFNNSLTIADVTPHEISISDFIL